MSATRINLAQSTNGIGWMLGPIIGSHFLLSSTGEANTSNANLYKPYLLVGIVVTVLFFVFLKCKLPDLKNEESTESSGAQSKGGGKPLFARWHFNFAVTSQFLYCAAQSGIFGFFVNYMISEVPVMNQAMVNKIPVCISQRICYPAATFSTNDFKSISPLVMELENTGDPKTKAVSLYVWSQVPTNAIADLESILHPDSDAAAADAAKKASQALSSAFNRVLTNSGFYTAERFAGITIPAETLKLASDKPAGESLARLNRGLIEAAYSDTVIARSAHLSEPFYKISESGAAWLLSFGGFGLFLIGRFCGSAVLGVCKANKTLAFYCAAAAVSMVLIVAKLQWISVAALFASFFFMSIMFPTIFALGIHGLGEHTKLASSLIVMAIVGAALIPILMGQIADKYGMTTSFYVPMVCFVAIGAYGLFWKTLQGSSASGDDEKVSVTAKH